MNAITSNKRRFLIAGAAILSVAAGAFVVGQFYPPLGPSAGTISPAQRYVDALGNGQIPMQGRYVLVDAASARLFMIEDGRVKDSMRVIVGKPDAATPALRSTIFYATFNPYWNVPPDLAQKLIAPRVVKDGTTYLTERHYEIVSGFGPSARVLPPDSVDWKKVAAGEMEVQVRQQPGPANSMGQVKFDLAYVENIYLHDTPKKDLFALADRNLSNGCVRLEDAPRFARWLLGDEPPPPTAAPEQHVELDRAVPITIAYLDARSQMQVAGLQ
ncbi:MAG: L,D-transpeptidase family protein [Sphingomicrobium sp.]